MHLQNLATSSSRARVYVPPFEPGVEGSLTNRVWWDDAGGLLALSHLEHEPLDPEPPCELFSYPDAALLERPCGETRRDEETCLEASRGSNLQLSEFSQPTHQTREEQAFRASQHHTLSDCNCRSHPEGNHLTESSQHPKPGELIIRWLPLFYTANPWVGLLQNNR